MFDDGLPILSQRFNVYVVIVDLDLGLQVFDSIVVWLLFQHQIPVIAIVFEVFNEIQYFIVLMRFVNHDAQQVIDISNASKRETRMIVMSKHMFIVVARHDCHAQAECPVFSSRVE